MFRTEVSKETSDFLDKISKGVDREPVVSFKTMHQPETPSIVIGGFFADGSFDDYELTLLLKKGQVFSNDGKMWRVLDGELAHEDGVWYEDYEVEPF